MTSSGKNIHIEWWSNKTGSSEVIFRGSDDNGQEFGDKINFSNTTDAQSYHPEILAVGDKCICFMAGTE